MEELARSQELDQKYFWYLISKNKGKKKGTSPIHNDMGELLTNGDEIREEWSNYFENLYKDNRTNEDTAFQKSIDETVKNLSKQKLKGEHLNGGPVTHAEIDKLIDKLKTKKAAGHDMIVNEHIKFGGKNLKIVLRYIINVTIMTEIIPDICKQGLIVPIPKAGKDPTYKDKNRGITLLPVLYKLIELIIEREQEWFLRNDVIDELQGAGQKHNSSLHTSFLLQEAINYNVERGETVYVAFLDIKKAFDTAWINGLMYKIDKAGIHKKAWCMILACFYQFKTAVFIDGKAGRWFEPERGVHQGAPLSMFLYMIYINDLLKQLKECGHGLFIADINASSPAFADDISTGSIHKSGLNSMLRIANRYSITWKYEYSNEKCVYMVWGNDRQSDLAVKLGTHELKCVKQCKHVGVD